MPLGNEVEPVSRGRAKPAEALSEVEGSGVCDVRIKTLGGAKRSRARQWSEAKRANESARCVTRKESATCA